MKFVSLLITAMILSMSAPAQTTGKSVKKTAVAKVQQKKSKKATSLKFKPVNAGNAETITLNDEKAHKAKWTFEEMLKRRLEIDAEDGKTRNLFGKEN